MLKALKAILCTAQEGLLHWDFDLYTQIYVRSPSFVLDMLSPDHRIYSGAMSYFAERYEDLQIRWFAEPKP